MFFDKYGPGPGKYSPGPGQYSPTSGIGQLGHRRLGWGYTHPPGRVMGLASGGFLSPSFGPNRIF